MYSESSQGRKNFSERPSDITVTLNLKLQQLAKEELNGRRGAVVALDPNTVKLRL